MAYSKNQHAEWLSLIEVSGPFLAEPILDQAFPQGLEKLDPIKKRQFRQTYDEWREVIDSDTQSDIEIKDKIHQQWIDWVLKFGLELDEDDDGDILKNQSQMSSSTQVHVTEHHVSLKPDYAIIASDAEKPYLLVQTYPPETKLSEVLPGDGWSTSPAERMAHLCRGVGTRQGIITNGEQWMFIDAPIGGITTYASWYARLWGLEPITLQAFYSLFNVGIVFNGFNEAKSLTALIDESLQYQEDVTHTLGTQVSRAVEVLIQSIDRINHDHNGQLLEGVEPEELYEAGLTFMMRLVFLLCAEERGLLLLGDQAYEANYALSTLRAKLREEASLHGDEVLSYRKNAWSRLLAIFRAVYAGVEHENMRMPALGGSLFDPDRFPFLEGRGKGSNWLEEQAKPLPIDNRTVLLFLDAIQLYQGRTLSYRALDVEQIGYVYEGLLEQTVKRAPDVTLELSGSKSCKKPWVYLGELASAELDGNAALQKLLKERTGSSASRITNDLKKEVTDADVDKLMVACYNDADLCKRIKRYYHFLRFDAWGNPLLYPKDAYMLTTGSDRRETGSHYTPKSLTESIVKETLEPIVYIGPAEGKPREEWELKSPEALLDLKICDPAMGSGAFLVQVCRWLAERVCEAWSMTEQQGAHVNSKGFSTNDDAVELIPNDPEERLLTARRLVSERCLYGVDVNPLAVELAKLSIWLVTLSKNRPFGFLDHNLKSGDSLLGIHNVNQLINLNVDLQKVRKSKQPELGFAKSIKILIEEALQQRNKIIYHDINSLSDISEISVLDQLAKRKILLPKLIADAFIGLTMESDDKVNDLSTLLLLIQSAISGNKGSIESLKNIASKNLGAGRTEKSKVRKKFHWPLEFPEVFIDDEGGFDAVVGNPPFVGGQKISGTMGNGYAQFLKEHKTFSKKAAVDLVVYFSVHCSLIMRHQGCCGLVVRRSISEGKNREVGLSKFQENGLHIYKAETDLPWPGQASVVVHHLHFVKGSWQGAYTLNQQTVDQISSDLSELGELAPKKIKENLNRIYQGVILQGESFKVNDEEMSNLIQLQPNIENIIQPFIGGNEVNNNYDLSPLCWVINLRDWPKEEVEKSYPHVMQYLEKTLLPELTGKDRLRKNWWNFLRPRPELYRAIGRGKEFLKYRHDQSAKKIFLERVLVISTGVTKYPCFTFLPTNMVFSNKLCVLASDSYEMFGVLSSDIHAVWAWKNKTSMGGDLTSMVYAHGNIFETFPFPQDFFSSGSSKKISNVAKSIFEKRTEYLRKKRLGLTKFYNDFHNPHVSNSELIYIRNLQRDLNQVVIDSYGWDDINLDTDFFKVGYLPRGKDTRFTINEESRITVLKRLYKLNKVIGEG